LDKGKRDGIELGSLAGKRAGQGLAARRESASLGAFLIRLTGRVSPTRSMPNLSSEADGGGRGCAAAPP